MAKAGRRIVPGLAVQPFETWQVGVVRLPLWFPRKDGDPFRPWIALCLDQGSGRILGSTPGDEEAFPALLEDVLSRASLKWRSRPARVQVMDVALVPILEGLQCSEGAAVELRPELPELGGALESLVREMRPEDPCPSLLSGDGVTLERVASFGRAAADFCAASGWRHLSREDRVRIEAPELPANLQHFFLIHQGGQSVPGLGFVRWIEDLQGDEEDFLDEEELLEEEDDEEDSLSDPGAGDDAGEKGFWALEFNPLWGSSPDDVDLWERHGLPLAGGRLIPSPLFLGTEIRRPDGRELAFFQGLLAALAATTEEDLDAGRWERQVATAEGPVRFVLSLSDLLEPPEEEAAAGPPMIWRVMESSMREMKRLLAEEDSALILGEDGSLSLPIPSEPREPATPQERAEAVLDRAWAARGRRMVLLARQALEIWPDCADAYNLLAQRAPDLEAAGHLYELAMAAGVRAMEPGTFDEAGHFWELIETRPYMRAREGLAQSLTERGRPAEAVEHFQEMLRLNPNDNQGVRYTLVHVLMTLDRDAEALDLLARYPEDFAQMEFPRALLQFRREGDSPEARRALKRALQTNRFVPGMLLRDRGLPFSAGMYSPGSQEEADIYFELAREAWAGTPGALDWLRKRTELPPRSKRRSKSKRKKKRR